ncbi:hypothetical protein [Consotaella aegiceratis]|uniref:hypothetical protein n=1 Tax=Consotaella aegiceratis TaxID=3097961 RepID=UPI002F40EC1C
MVEAIAEKLTLDGGDATKASMILASAQDGDAAALATLKGLLLPPPQVRLAMPVQALTREHRAWALPFAARLAAVRRR